MIVVELKDTATGTVTGAELRKFMDKEYMCVIVKDFSTALLSAKELHWDSVDELYKTEDLKTTCEFTWTEEFASKLTRDPKKPR